MKSVYSKHCIWYLQYKTRHRTLCTVFSPLVLLGCGLFSDVLDMEFFTDEKERTDSLPLLTVDKNNVVCEWEKLNIKTLPRTNKCKFVLCLDVTWEHLSTQSVGLLFRNWIKLECEVMWTDMDWHGNLKINKNTICVAGNFQALLSMDGYKCWWVVGLGC